MGNAPDAVKRLVDHFDQDRKVFLSGDHKEEQLRAEFGQRTCRLRFLNPFFTALGWNMDNKQGLSDLSACSAQAETFKQVIHEESIKVAGASALDSVNRPVDFLDRDRKVLTVAATDKQVDALVYGLHRLTGVSQFTPVCP